MQTFFIAPTDFGVGLTSISLGLVRTLERAGLKVGFFKPIAQPHPGDLGPERSTELMARTHGLKPPKPLGLAHVERMLGDGQLDELLEEIINLYQQAAVGKDVLVVEGMVPTRSASYAARVNLHLAKSLDADVILVSAPENEVLAELSGRVELQAQLFGGPKDPKVLGVILNKVRTEESMEVFSSRLKEHSPLLRSGDFRLLGCIPYRAELNAPRTRDVAELLGAQVLNAGDYDQRRMSRIIICARTVLNTVPLLKPGVLVVTPGDRDDIILAVSLAAINGVPLAGLLLTSDTVPDPRIMELCRGAFQAGLPVLSVSSGSYDTANRLNQLNKEIPIDDRERAENITDFVAGHLDAGWLHQRCGTPRELRLSPAVFRYQLIQRAQAANKRIVLPEGNEPLTIQAAAICQARGIARCVLLARPEEVQAVAQAHGIELPPGLEILDPELIRERYVAPMVELKPERAHGRATARRPGGHRHRNAGAGRSRRSGIGCHSLHRQHHPACPATDQDRAGLHAGVFGIFHAVPRAGADVRRLHHEPASECQRAVRDRLAKRRLSHCVRHFATGSDDQLFQRQLGQRRRSGEGPRSNATGTRNPARSIDRRAAAV
ncbi:Phosphate acetyltransferase [Pseudomonas syringae pv. broussonetiae]|uniref:Phosphate acetyltransferase n=1 Tax=Pseudomonas savastanoi TaxID=29438 RepID=A0A3M5JD33_PSESS|nr:Phosphate acetyltransferase [Pseudomonas syringae pv. broussonetiae]RMT21345.1 Phosphate acetyltransferase [Pseudomonas savastanoi]